MVKSKNANIAFCELLAKEEEEEGQHSYEERM
jgi:hypothetical protein